MLQEGVTLIEALVTLGIVSVALAVGVPAVRDIVATNRMSSAVNDIVTSLHISRNEAVKRAEQTVLCASTNWSLPSAQCEDVNLAEGWIVFTDDNPRNGARDAAEIVVFAHQPLGQGITLTVGEPGSILGPRHSDDRRTGGHRILAVRRARQPRVRRRHGRAQDQHDGNRPPAGRRHACGSQLLRPIDQASTYE